MPCLTPSSSCLSATAVSGDVAALCGCCRDLGVGFDGTPVALSGCESDVDVKGDRTVEVERDEAEDLELPKEDLDVAGLVRSGEASGGPKRLRGKRSRLPSCGMGGS